MMMQYCNALRSQTKPIPNIKQKAKTIIWDIGGGEKPKQQQKQNQKPQQK